MPSFRKNSGWLSCWVPWLSFMAGFCVGYYGWFQDWVLYAESCGWFGSSKTSIPSALLAEEVSSSGEKILQRYFALVWSNKLKHHRLDHIWTGLKTTSLRSECLHLRGEASALGLSLEKRDWQRCRERLCGVGLWPGCQLVLLVLWVQSAVHFVVPPTTLFFLNYFCY